MTKLGSLMADLEAANRRIAEQDKLIINLVEELNRSRGETIDAREHRDMYCRELRAIKGGINTTNAQE